MQGRHARVEATLAGAALAGFLLSVAPLVAAQEASPPPAATSPADTSPADTPPVDTSGAATPAVTNKDEQAEAATVEAAEATREPWIDRMHYGLYWTLWRSAMRIDRMFGGGASAAEYQDISGSLAPSILWDEFDGFRPKLRFRVNLPLPLLNERFDAFIGRVNREEYVTERRRESGALASQRGTPVEDDQTLLGIRYRELDPDDRFSASAGVRVRFPLDPYVKGSWRYGRGSLETAQLTLRETAFWQNSEDFGFTSRVDVEHLAREKWLLRWTASGTISQVSEGVRGYTSFTVLREFPDRRAAIAELFTSAEVDADVPLRDFGIKLAWRKSVTRDWLVLELRTGVTWPKDDPQAPRKPSWALGVGLEVFFGTEDFEARPTTF